MNAQTIVRGIEQAIKDELKDEIEKQMNFARKEMEKRAQETIAKIVVHLFDHMSFERMGSDLVIRIQKIE
jgi:hypothetical protein